MLGVRVSFFESQMQEIRTSWFDKWGVETELRAVVSLLESTLDILLFFKNFHD